MLAFVNSYSALVCRFGSAAIAKHSIGVTICVPHVFPDVCVWGGGEAHKRERLSCALQKVVFHSGHVTKYPVDGCPEEKKKLEKMRVVKKKKIKEQREKMTDVGWKQGGDYKFIIRRVQ